MRKLLHAFHDVFKTHQPYDGQQLNTLTSPALAPALANSEVACIQT